MKRGLETAAAVCMAMLAIAWPLEANGFVPGLAIDAPTLLAAIGIALLTVHTFFQGRLRLSFELVVPWLLALALTTWLVATMTAPWPAEALCGLFAFALPLHFRPARGRVVALLALTVIAGTGMAGITLAGWILGRVPTAYSLETGANLHFAHDVGGGIVTLLLCMVAALGLILNPGTRWWVRALWAMAAVTLGAVVATAAGALMASIMTPGPPRLLHHGSVVLLLALVLLYGSARIAAKIAVNAEERLTSMHVVFLTLVAIGAVAVIAIRGVAPIGMAFLAGLACAYVLPSEEPVGSRAWVFCGLAAGTILLALNVSHVNSGSLRDARNYDVALEKDFAVGDYMRAHQRLDLIERLAPHERRTHWWRARVLLAQGRPMRAVTEFGASLTEADSTLLPAPNQAERNLFLVQLRDAESASTAPQHHYAYARALVAAGEIDEALASVRMHAMRPATEIPNLASDPLAQAVAFLLGNRSLSDTLRTTWTPTLLLTTLGDWDATIMAAPPWFDHDRLPAVFVGQFALHTSEVLVALPGDTDFQEKPFDVDPAGTGEEVSYWTPIFGHERKWVVEWIAPSQGRGPARVTGRNTTWDVLTYTTTLASIPERAAVTIWLPEDIMHALDRP